MKSSQLQKEDLRKLLSIDYLKKIAKSIENNYIKKIETAVINDYNTFTSSELFAKKIDTNLEREILKRLGYIHSSSFANEWSYTESGLSFAKILYMGTKEGRKETLKNGF